jgi:hypothetical protein
MRAASGWSLNSEFDEFLFASIGEEQNGGLSVISMMGRLDIDPRQEAHKLAGLPRPTAIQQLALMIESLPDRMTSAADSKAIATRLLTKLPLRKMTLITPPIPLNITAKPLATMPWMIILVVATVLLLGISLFSQSGSPSPSEPPKSSTNRP